MAQQVRVYLKKPVENSAWIFFGKIPKINTEPGWPGEYYVDFELSQFFEGVAPVLKKGIQEQIEKSPEFVAASITTPIKGIDEKSRKLRNGIEIEGIGMTVDTSEFPYQVTIWAPTMLEAIKQLQLLDPE